MKSRTTHGIISVEYNPKLAQGYDGLCVTILVSIAKSNGKNPKVANNDDYGWHTIQNLDVATALSNKQHNCLSLIDITRDSGNKMHLLT